MSGPQRFGPGSLRKGVGRGRGVRTAAQRRRRITEAESVTIKREIAMDNLMDLSDRALSIFYHDDDIESMARALANFLKDNLAFYKDNRRHRHVSEVMDADGLLHNSLLAREFWLDHGLMNHYVLRREGEPRFLHVARARFIPFGTVGNDPAGAIETEVTRLGSFPDVHSFVQGMRQAGERLSSSLPRVLVDVRHDPRPPRVVTDSYLRNAYAVRDDVPILRTTTALVMRTMRDGTLLPDSEAIVIPIMRFPTLDEVVGVINDGLWPRGERVADGRDHLGLSAFREEHARTEPIGGILVGEALRWENYYRLHYQTVPLDEAERAAPPPVLYQVEACEYHAKSLTLAYQGSKRPEAWEIAASLQGYDSLVYRKNEEFSTDFSLKWMRKEMDYSNQLSPLVVPATGEMLMDPTDDNSFVVYRKVHTIAFTLGDEDTDWMSLEGDPATWTMTDILSAYLRSVPEDAPHASELRFYAGSAHDPYGDDDDDDEGGGDEHRHDDLVKVPIINDRDVREYLVERKDEYGLLMVFKPNKDDREDDDGEDDNDEDDDDDDGEGGLGGVAPMDTTPVAKPLRFKEGQRVTSQHIHQDELLENIMVTPSGCRGSGSPAP